MKTTNALQMSEIAVLANVPAIHHRVVHAASDAGATDDVGEEIGLFVSEAVANAVRHAYDGSAPRVVEIIVNVEDGELRAVVRDHGKGLPSTVPRGSNGGFGLRIIERLARSTSISAAPGGGTEVRMSFSLVPPSAHTSA